MPDCHFIHPDNTEPDLEARVDVRVPPSQQ
jgi:hypothetical protein